MFNIPDASLLLVWMGSLTRQNQPEQITGQVEMDISKLVVRDA
jgi:hypothetical protein